MCALLSNSSLRCWGSNEYGQCNVPDGLLFHAFSVGYLHTCGIVVASSGLLCFGFNRYMTSGGACLRIVPAIIAHACRFGETDYSDRAIAAFVHAGDYKTWCAEHAALCHAL